MKTIAIFNQKGGVGKTTTNINLASYIAEKGFKVLVIDIDPQGNTTSGLGIDKNSLDNSIYDLLLTDINISEVIKSVDFSDNLFLIPSNIDLAGADIELSSFKNREKVLREKLKEIKSEFDFIFIDCPPSLGLLTLNALVSADSVLIPMQCEYYALEGISQLIRTIDKVKNSMNKELKIEGVLLTMYDSRRNLEIQVAEELKSYFGELVFENSIPRNIRLAEAPSHGIPIMLYEPNAKGAEAYDSLAVEFLEKQGVI
ncbi:MAG: ParA family protein [Clostridium sp.]|nr:ParA family protein [Clostridium sp.]